ncbi:hypothetical protein C5Z25_12050 [Lactobacillus sp. CBA3605]|uniref:hypothetical protein n=1 Tax=Lactobacillus sp. CBA3605 TaxID=2099788 RepID=UPI000CFDEC42|nr:hypothetical protein [Lactobacillus sp. CBA3605]AVK62445.1 hypothetical protein C5Z25_12050 [Lactobacillus sp. CBA3605]
MIKRLQGVTKTLGLKAKNETIMDLELHWCNPHEVPNQLKAMGDNLSFADCQCVLMILGLRKAESWFINNNLRQYGLSLDEFTESLNKLKRHDVLDYKYTQTSARHVKGWILA